MLVVVGDQIDHENILSTSRMHKGIVVFLKEQNLVNRFIMNGLVINGVQLYTTLYTIHKSHDFKFPVIVSDEFLQCQLA